MDHQYIQENDIIDKYVLHQLTDKEEADFEEHHLLCEECQNELLKRKVLKGIIRMGVLEEEIRSDKKKRSIRYFPFILKAAASVVLVFSIIWLISTLTDRRTAMQVKSFDRSSGKDSSLLVPVDTFMNDKTHDKDQYQLAEAFIERPDFESYINNATRGNEIIVRSPELNETFSSSERILFDWDSSNFDSLYLVVFNNTAHIIYENRIPDHWKFIPEFGPGLYYWQLETAEEALYTGKFFIRPR